MRTSSALFIFLLLFTFNCKTTNSTPIAKPSAVVQTLLQTLDSGKILEEGDCYSSSKNEYNPDSIDAKCMEKFQQAMQASGVFSQQYLNDMKKEIAEKQGKLAKGQSIETNYNHYRFFFSQDPPSAKDVLNDLAKATTEIEGKQAKVKIKMTSNNKQTFLYQLENLNNQWKIISISDITKR